jgi:hypothetical protein
MADQDFIGEILPDHDKASPWAVAVLIASLAFTAGALLLLVMSWR